ncbi:MAG: hypothetical protein ACK55Z_32830, partial [bacterium]
ELFHYTLIGACTIPLYEPFHPTCIGAVQPYLVEAIPPYLSRRHSILPVYEPFYPTCGGAVPASSN